MIGADRGKMAGAHPGLPVGCARTTTTPPRREKRTREKRHVTVVRTRPRRCLRAGAGRAPALRARASRRVPDPARHHHRVAGARHRNGYRGAPLWREARTAPRAPVVIENRPGGAGVVAGETIAKGTPDGY